MTTTTTSAQPRSPSLDRRAAMRLAATEYDRVVALLRQLSAEDWHQPTDNTGWDVRALAATCSAWPRWRRRRWRCCARRRRRASEAGASTRSPRCRWKAGAL
jgi:hypothetical protein